MPDRYWVGGTASWDGTAGTKWAATSGGAGGASEPTNTDAVFFDANSGASTVTLVGNVYAQSITCTGFTGTLTGAGFIQLYGSLTLVSAMGFSVTGTLVCNRTGTLTTAGKTLANITISGAGIPLTVTLGDALTCGVIENIDGTFTTNNFNVNATQLVCTSGSNKTINLGSSTVTLSLLGTAFNVIFPSLLTFNAGTSTIIFTASTVTLQGGNPNQIGPTFNNVQFTNTSVAQVTIRGINTFNNLAMAGPASAGFSALIFATRQTINGVLSTTGTAGNRRVQIRSETYGLAETLVINSAASLVDADFRDIYVTGTAAPISGTRVGDLRGCQGITFSAPKNVFWVASGSANWSSNSWAATSGGAASTNNFPLAQDTAVINNAVTTAGSTITIDSGVIPNVGTLDASARTNGLNINPNFAVVHGNWINGSGITLTGSGTTLTFSGRRTQTITSAGKAFLGGITVDSYDGTVQLADALNLATNSTTLTVTNGTFDTAGFTVSAGALASSNSNVRSILLRASTVTLSLSSPLTLSTTNLTFNAGTSTINLSSPGLSINTPGLTYNNVAFTDSSSANAITIFCAGAVFNNFTVTAFAFSGVKEVRVEPLTSFTVNGTLTVSGASPIRRLFLRSQTLNSPTTINVSTLSATDCDFSDIIITGAAAGSSPTRAGDCGGNTGVNFPAPKTVFWNLSGTQNWSATGWAATSGGTPGVNNFPLAQDTATFDNAGAAGTVTIDAAWAIGTVAMGGRTTAMTLATNGVATVYGNWTFGTGVTSGSGISTVNFGGRSTQTITSNGVTFNHPVTINKVSGVAQLADALTLSSARTLTLTSSGTFDAVTYNVTIGAFSTSGGTPTMRMGTGTWTLSGTGTVWSIASSITLNSGTANILLSDTSTSARTFSGSGLSYNRLTIGGATGTSTLTIQGDSFFTELASTKTVAHTIALGTTALTLGAWTVTGTAGNVVTLTGTGTTHVLAGPATSGIDYLAMGSIGFSSTSPGEFYAGANSTGTAGAPVFRTAPPAPRTLYWVGGTGNWSSTARWSTASGGAGGAAVPTSLDSVIFDSASNATAYTATVDTASRFSTLTVAGPASGNLTLAGSQALIAHGNVTLPATGLTRTFTGPITLSGTGSGKVLTTNGVTLASAITVNGIGASWALGSALNMGTSVLTLTTGSFSVSSFNLTASAINSNFNTVRTIDFGSGTTTLSDASTPINFLVGTQTLTVVAGTSQINLSGVSPDIRAGNKTYNNVTYTGISFSANLTGGNTFNNLTFNARTSTGVTTITFSGTTTVTGTLSRPAGTDATRRHVFSATSATAGATLVCAATSLTDVDFRNITISGAAAPASGTRLGNRGGNTGITFPAPKTVYWNLAGNQNWSATGWATTIGGAPAANNLPLAQDTAVFTATSPASGSTITFDQAYAVGTVDMSARTADTLTLSVTSFPFVTGDWIHGTGTTLSGTGTVTFGGRTTQTVTSAGRPFVPNFTVDSPGGSVTLQDAIEFSTASTSAFALNNGTFNANNYNVTFSASTNGRVTVSAFGTRTLAVGSGTWVLAASGTPWSVNGITNLTITGTGTIRLTSASGKTFTGAGASYTGITLDQGGAGTLTITGNNTFANITNTFKSTGATTIDFGNTTQRVAQWTAAGETGRLLTILGTSESSPATLILTSTTKPNVDFLVIQNVRAYAITDTWYAGNNSQNIGSLGWYFRSDVTIYNVFISETATALDAVLAAVSYPSVFVDTVQALDQLSAIFVAQTNVSETTQAQDTAATNASFVGTISETSQAQDVLSASAAFNGAVVDTSSVSDSATADASASRAVSESATAQDTQVVAASAFTAPFVDTASGADNTSAVNTLGAAVADTALVLDAASAVAVVDRSVADTATATDTSLGSLVVPAASSETASAQDTQVVAASAFSGIAAETASATDTTRSLALFGAAVADTVRPADTPSSVVINRVAVAESVSATDINAANAVFRAAFADSGTAQDQPTSSGIFVRFVVDSAQTADTVFSQPVYLAEMQDTAQVSDASQAAYTAVSVVDETALAAVEFAVDASVFNAGVAELVIGQEVFVAGGVFFVSLVEFGRIEDQTFGRFLWNPIPDAQIPNWQLINDTQTAGWVVINDEQIPVWTPILP